MIVMKMKHILIAIIISITLGIVCLFSYIITYPRQHISRQTAIKFFEYIKKSDTLKIPEEGVVPDEETAIKIAFVLLSKKYGQRAIRNQKPFDVYLIDGYWHVNGTLPKGVTGGTGSIIISKKDGSVIHMAHYR